MSFSPHITSLLPPFIRHHSSQRLPRSFTPFYAFDPRRPASCPLLGSRPLSALRIARLWIKKTLCSWRGSSLTQPPSATLPTLMLLWLRTPEASPDLCEWPERGRRGIREGEFHQGTDCPAAYYKENPAPANEDGGKLNGDPLEKAIERAFGSVEDFKKQFNTTTAAIQVSGWGWLMSAHVPVIGVDIWEHVSILPSGITIVCSAVSNGFVETRGLSQGPDYLNAIWDIIDFKEAEKRFLEASQ
ncbi:hypothetical protein NMY22_g17282 [Coprinellus aureogranulatus]|nr:hypothetical protein NMY22_g17282 [Coprinellus aureogranulatus]